MGLVIVVAAIIISMGASILGEFATQTCTGTYVDTGVARNDLNTSVNPVTSSKYGCCTAGAWNGSACTNWDTTAKTNVTQKGNVSLATFGNWIPLISLVVVAAIVIGVIVGYLGRGSGSV